MYHEELAGYNEPPPDPFLRMEIMDRSDEVLVEEKEE